ncbi:helix-turn-helix transcriptional regulator [uncultured Microbacterium sp.]|uniref:helix-turn-helix domain-containing protein n=1 Tax=uncultured Microbacterium sp. TaxID=191216 RepID=UPI0028D67868|nr:helix-turn-helix transcriptional regulator [uncultured Microbacterium sp.]
MPTDSKPPTGRTVAANIRRIRQHRRMRLEDVASLLAFHGRPIGKATLSLIENGQRRVDVDDLMAFARVLRVTPVDLLVPPAFPEGHTVVAMTGFPKVDRATIGPWIRHEEPLQIADDVPGLIDVTADDWLGHYRVDARQLGIAPASDDFPARENI